MEKLLQAFDPDERRRMVGLTGSVVALHVLGVALLLVYAPDHPVLGGLTALAYSFGLRHAFDADHISAIDNTTRKLLADGARPLSVGFFFSLGHSTVVLVLSLGIAVAAGTVHAAIPALHTFGGTIGTVVSGLFLWTIAVLNLAALKGIVAVAREAKNGRFNEAELEARLQERGFMNRFFGRALQMVRRSEHIYPVGVLFGLGFDTATEVGLLALTAGAATGHVPPLAVLALPVLFAAGMSLMDTADGVFMSKAYGWAFSSPARKIYYNLAVTGLSVLVAMLIGTIELLQVALHRLGLSGGVWGCLQALDFGSLGYAIVALFALTWIVALVIWRRGRIEERWTATR